MRSDLSTPGSPYVKRSLKLAVWGIVAAGIALALSKPVSRSLAERNGRKPETTLAGSIRPHSFAAISSQFPGQVTSLRVSPGQKVKAGDPLLTIHNPEFEMEFERASIRLQDVQARFAAHGSATSVSNGNIDLRSANSALHAAEQRLSDFSLDEQKSRYEASVQKVRQMETLVHQQLATEAELQQAQAVEDVELRNLRAEREHLSRLKEEREIAAARVEALEHGGSGSGAERMNLTAELREAATAFRIASQRRTSQTVLSTVSGTVLKTSVSVGDQIPSGLPLLQVGQLDILDVDVPVAAELARRLMVGQRVDVRVPTEPPLQTTAPISAVMLMPSQDQSAYTVRITMNSPSDSTILVGLAAEVQFPHSEAAWRGFPF